MYRQPQPSNSKVRALYAEKIFANALGKVVPSSTPIIDIENIMVEPQQSFKVLDQGERGELLWLEIAANSTLITPEIILYDDKGQAVTVVNRKTFQQLLALGRGMTPGRVQPSATGQSQDEAGIFVPNMFHIARYKDDQLTDWFDTATENPNPDRYIVGRMVCVPPMPYSSISFYIKNTTTDSAKKVYSVSVARTVYEIPASAKVENVDVNNIKSVEILGEDVSEEDESVDTSQFVTNYNVAPT